MAAIVVTITPTGKPVWSREAAIGDYDGAFTKEDNTTEATIPYAAQIWRELRAMRGSAYTTKPRTLVDAENVAIARMFGAVWYRLPEKVRANATPLRCDEKLEYWVEVLGIPKRPNEQRWQLRDRASAHFQAAAGPTMSNITSSLAALLGDAFVEATHQEGVDLATPPAQTFWPGINPGDPTYSLGRGAWMSERCHLAIETQIPAGMTDGEFLHLVNVEMFSLLDTLLPAWATWGWAVSTGGALGFYLDVSRLDFDGVTPT
jgi:uncharacterized protein (DUF2237 family)